MRSLFSRLLTRSKILNLLLLTAIGGFFCSILLTLIDTPTEENAGILSWMMMALEAKQFIYQPWGIVTYPFFTMVKGPTGMPLTWVISFLFNIVFIYHFGRLFHQYLGEEKLRNSILFNIFFIAILTFGILNLFPDSAKGTYMFGLSPVAVMLVVAAVTLMPSMKVRLMIFGAVPIWAVGIIIVSLKFLSIASLTHAPEAIGMVAGGIFGFVYVKLLRRGNDIPGKLVEVVEKVGKVRKQGEELDYNTLSPEMRQDEIDRILDKINEVGYRKLTRKEKEFLAKAGDDKHIS